MFKLDKYLNKNKECKDLLKGYKLFNSYNLSELRGSFNSNHLTTILHILYDKLGIENKTVSFNYEGLLIGNELKIEKSDLSARRVNNYYKDTHKINHFILNKVVNCFEGFESLFNSFGKPAIFGIYKNSEGDLKFVVLTYPYGESYFNAYIFDFYYVEDTKVLEENAIYGYLKKLKELDSKYESGIWHEYYDRCSLKFNSESSFLDKYLLFYLNNKCHKINGNLITKVEYAYMKYYIIIKEEGLYSYLKDCKYINNNVLKLCIESDFKITNVQANLLNHLLGQKCYLFNGHGGMFYNLKENGIGWSHSREWVKKQLEPFIDSGLIKLEIINSPRDARYKLWYFYENIDGLCEENLLRKGYGNWQTKLKQL